MYDKYYTWLILLLFKHILHIECVETSQTLTFADLSLFQTDIVNQRWIFNTIWHNTWKDQDYLLIFSKIDGKTFLCIQFFIFNKDVKCVVWLPHKWWREQYIVSVAATLHSVHPCASEFYHSAMIYPYFLEYPRTPFLINKRNTKCVNLLKYQSGRIEYKST